MNNMLPDSCFIHGIDFSDAFAIYVAGTDNTHNIRILGTGNPRDNQHQFQNEKVTFWLL